MALSLRQSADLRQGNQKITQSHEVIAALDELLSSAQNAETGPRGFLLTNNEKYLEPYSNALEALPTKLDEVAALSRENPVHRSEISALRARVAAKLTS